MSTRIAIVLAAILLVGSLAFAFSWRSPDDARPAEGNARPASQGIFPKVQNPGG